MKNKLLLSFFLIFGSVLVKASNVNSVSNGNWTASSTWNTNAAPNTGADAITVSNYVLVNTGISLSGTASLLVTGTLIDPAGGSAYGISLSNSSQLTISGNTTFEGDLTVQNNATVTINSGDTLTVANASFSNNAVLVINAGGVLIVNGNLSASNNNNSTVDGTIIVNGNVTGSNNASFSGTGSITATGTISTGGGSTVFGGSGSCTNCTVSGSAPLPIELIEFSAKPDLNKIRINWTTVSEINNDYFVIEKSTDAKLWNEVLRQSGAGNSIRVINYSGFDNDPCSGISYYRLKQVDKNGAFKYFNIVEVTLIKKPFVSVYPNPASTNLTLDVSDDYFNTNAKVIDLLGNEVHVYAINANSNQIDLSGMSSGFYYLLINNGKDDNKIKIIVQR